MAADLGMSVTKENLMRAFAGESQARNRYTYAAGQASKQKLPVIEAIFKFTANQEKEHGEIFYNYLKEFSGNTVDIAGGYPVDISDSISKLLRFAEHNENEEETVIYPAFADKAEEEGFVGIAASFRMIAEIEKTHKERFAHFAELMENNKLFISDVKTGWICLNCGYIYEGMQVPDECPVCSHEKGYFIRCELSLF